MQVKQFIKERWKDFADYDNRRSLPHVIDGLKITQRKAMYAAIKIPKGDKPHRVSQFASKAAEITAYHHGEQSMISTVVKLAQDFPGANNYPLLERHGQFGSRLSHAASAPRYIHTRLHSNWDRFFKKEDQEIVEYLYDDGDQIEPKYFIPIVPVILLNGANGIGNGFACNILPYSLESVVKAIKEIAKHGKVKTPLIPSIVGYRGTIEKKDRQIIFKGKIEKVNSTKLLITELPPFYENSEYKAVLNKLIDNKFIKDYQNRSTEEKWEFVVDCYRESTALDIEVLLEKFGLVQKTTENFVCWGMDESAPLQFNGPEELLEYWYAERLKLYQKSIDYHIAKLKREIVKLDTKFRFIQWCLKNDFRKLTKAEFIAKSVEGVKKLTPELAEEFVSMPIYRITVDEAKKAELDIEAKVDKLVELEKTKPVDLLLNNLNRI